MEMTDMLKVAEAKAVDVIVKKVAKSKKQLVFSVKTNCSEFYFTVHKLHENQTCQDLQQLQLHA